MQIEEQFVKRKNNIQRNIDTFRFLKIDDGENSEKVNMEMKIFSLTAKRVIPLSGSFRWQ